MVRIVNTNRNDALPAVDTVYVYSYKYNSHLYYYHPSILHYTCNNDLCSETPRWPITAAYDFYTFDDLTFIIIIIIILYYAITTRLSGAALNSPFVHTLLTTTATTTIFPRLVVTRQIYIVSAHTHTTSRA